MTGPLRAIRHGPALFARLTHRPGRISFDRSGASRPDRGFALLIVLWWTVFLALLGTQLAGVGQLEARRAGNLRSAAAAEAAADGALQEAVFHLLASGADRWAADEAVHTLSLPGGRASVAVANEAAKIGLNQATAGLLTALLTQLGETRQQAAVLADAIVAWRTSAAGPGSAGAKTAAYAQAGAAYAPPDADFETLDELALVAGMTPALLHRLQPYLSVYQTGDPDLASADPLVRAAWAQSGDIGASDTSRFGLQSDARPILAVSVQVAMASGAHAAHRTVVLLAEDSAHHAFQVLDRDH